MHDNISTHDLIISVFKALFHVDIKAILKKLLRETASTGQTTVRIAKGVGFLGPLPSLQEDKRIRLLLELSTRSFLIC
jgi:hypothetical protein